MIAAATGHRPDKLGGYGEDVRQDLLSLAKNCLSILKPTKCISGMAVGWDMAWACAAIELGIPLICAIPFQGQERKWPAHVQQAYRHLLCCAERVVTVCPGEYDPAKMQKRNVWMVDHCTVLISLWNGTQGGTANCLYYARTVDRRTHNLWAVWQAMQRAP